MRRSFSASKKLDVPLRFSRRLTLVPGLRVNLSRSGASLSVGSPVGATKGVFVTT